MLPAQGGFFLLLPWMESMEVFLCWAGGEAHLVVGGLADGAMCHLACSEHPEGAFQGGGRVREPLAELAVGMEMC